MFHDQHVRLSLIPRQNIVKTAVIILRMVPVLFLYMCLTHCLAFVSVNR